MIQISCVNLPDWIKGFYRELFHLHIWGLQLKGGMRWVEAASSVLCFNYKMKT